MTKLKSKSIFFDNDLIIIGQDEDDDFQDISCGGAKQSSLDLEALLDDLPEYVPETKKASGAVSPSVPATVEEPKQRKESFLSESKLFDHLLEHYPIQKYGNMPYIRRGYVWLPVSEDVVGALLMESLPEEKRDSFNSKQSDHVAYRIILDNKFKEDSLKIPPQVMLFRNGCFSAITHEQVTPHDDWFFPFCINADFDPDCDDSCPVFDRFMAQLSNHDDEIYNLFMVFLAYCLMAGAPLKKIFVMGPEPDTGKSLLGEWLQHYVGEDQTTAIPLEKFSQNFAIADIVGKSILFSMELPADPLPSKATIVAKNITGHDKIQIQQKYLKAFKYRPHAKIICGTNHAIRSDDAPFWRRLQVLPCLNSIPPESQDEELLEKLFAEENAIMLKIMEFARKLVLNGMEFPYCSAAEEVKQDWQRNNVPHLARFIEERCTLDSTARCWSEDLHDAFERYCAARDTSAPSTKALVEAIKIGWPELRHDRWAKNGRQGRGFYGIRLI